MNQGAESKDDLVSQESSRSKVEEIDKRLKGLYEQFISFKKKIGNPSLVKQISRRLGRDDSYASRRELNIIESSIAEELRERPGNYPLKELVYTTDPLTGQNGFSFSFDYKIGDNTFSVGFWINNRYGIAVQRHDKGYEPSIQVLEDFDKTLFSDHILHLPEGYKIPVGPLYFEADSVPMTETEVANNKRKAEEIAKSIGIKVDKEAVANAGAVISQSTYRKSSPRYFNWEPILPENPARIAINFAAIDYRQLAIVPENSQILTETTVKGSHLD